MVRFSWGRLALKSGLYTMLGQHRSSVMVSLVRRDRVVAVDLPVVKGEVEVTACVQQGSGSGDLRCYVTVGTIHLTWAKVTSLTDKTLRLVTCGF